MLFPKVIPIHCKQFVKLLFSLKDKVILILEEDKAGEHSSPMRNNPPHQPSMWNDPTFDDMKFTSTILPFDEDFLGDYISNETPQKLSNLKENHILRVLLMEWVDSDKHAQIMNELKYSLLVSQGNVTKGHAILNIFLKENEDLATKLQIAE